MKFTCPVCQIAVLLAMGLAGNLSAAEPLHDRIDRLIEARVEARLLAAPADDATFARRVYLDFTGQIPAAAQLRAFLADTAADKRTRLIDELLATPEYPRRMAEAFNVLLMERRGGNAEWEQYLHDSFAANKPWDQLVREMLDPGSQPEAARPAIYFYQKRLEKYGQNPTDFPGLTRDVARLFLGEDLQCAQCHNHLFIDDYKQVDFQGLYTVFLNVSIKKGKDKFPDIVEKPMTARLQFTSVFDPTQKATGPRLPGGKEFDIPEKVSKESPFSPLSLIARELPRADNPQFTRNIANRLWQMMLGRGLVHPVDLFHSENPPSHPELLDLLAREFAEHQFDIRWMLRELALSRVYGRSGLVPAGADAAPLESFAVSIERRLSPEQLLWSTLLATGERDRVQQIGETAAKHPSGPTFQELQKAFLKTFANEPRDPEDDYRATVAGALFLLNDDRLLQLLQPRPDNLIDRLSKLTDSSEIADELFVCILSRLPTSEERAQVAEYLAAHADQRTTALGQLAWALLASMEFSVNH